MIARRTGSHDAFARGGSPEIDEDSVFSGDSPGLVVAMVGFIVIAAIAMSERTNRFRIDESDILERARSSHGLERLDQIKYAILEPDGQVSIIPR